MKHFALAVSLALAPLAATADNTSDSALTTEIAKPAPANIWAGFYGGLSYNRTGYDIDVLINGNLVNSIEGEDSSAAGLFGGYNWQRGSLVYGGELSYIGHNSPVVGISDAFQDDILQIRARVGYTITPDFLVYGFVGLAQSSANDADVIIDQSGTSYGVGADYMITDSMFAGIEYSVFDISGGSSALPPGGKLVTSMNAISLRIGYKF